MTDLQQHTIDYLITEIPVCIWRLIAEEALPNISDFRGLSFDIEMYGVEMYRVEYINFLTDEASRSSTSPYWNSGKNGCWFTVTYYNIKLMGVSSDMVFDRDSKTFQSIIQYARLMAL